MAMTCYRDGGCGPYEYMSCSECPASKPEYAKNRKQQEEYNQQIEAFFECEDAIKKIINAVNNHAISFDDAAKIVKACAPYCDEKTADGFIKWLQSWYNTTIPKSVTTMYIDGFGNRKSKCPNCNQTIIKCEHPRFCGGCGQAVYWE